MSQETSSSPTKEKIHGRENDLNSVLEMMLSENGGSNAAISVLPIVGKGGVGKTTLAQLVCADERVCEHFDVTGWHCVSDNFDLARLMRELIESFTKVRCDLLYSNDLHNVLGREVMGKKVLIVLDDVWYVSEKDREFFLSSLRSAQSNRILVTTRVDKLASVVQTTPPYRLGGLTPEDSWSLFDQLVFSYEDIDVSDDMIEIGRKIVDKCDGVPLAIKVIGNFLRSSDIMVWKEILSSETWRSDSATDLLPVLYLSYYNLPPELKLCFPILSLFPKGFVFSKDDVIKIWMSFSFLDHENGLPPEDVGNLHFNELLRRSFIDQNQCDKRLEGYIMHDLIHDLAEAVAGNEFSRIDAEMSSVVQEDFIVDVIAVVRYISIIVNTLPNTINLHLFQAHQRLRVLKIINLANKWNNRISIDIPDDQFQILKFVRVLDFSHTGIEVLPYSIGNLRQLGYLNLTKTNVKRLPESISNLHSLHTLELRDCSIQELPSGIINLVNLRHLNFSDKNTCMPSGIGALTNLQTLPVFNIKKGIWHCRISELKGLVNLHGELTITGLRNVMNIESVKEANLRNKIHLRELTLDWTTRDHVKCDHSNSEAENSSHEQCSEEEVLDYLQPNFGLEELHIYDYSGSIFPNWIGSSSFHRLSKISISGCGESCEFLSALGLLPSLKSLSIQWMYSIRRIGREFCSGNTATKGFQSLKTLEFKYLPNWVDWYGVQDGEFVKLRTLRIVCCHELQSLPQPLSSALTKLLISNCKELRTLPFLPLLTRLALTGELSESLLHNLHLKSLRFLKVASSKSITCILLNGDQLPSLEVLVIRGCKNLEYLTGVSNMTSLKRLKIIRCPWVQTSSHEEIPPQLLHLKIVKCPRLQEWHQVMIVKYRNQLRNVGNLNNKIKTVERLRDDEVMCESVFEESCKVEVSSMNDDEMFVENSDDKMIVENEMEGNDIVEMEKEWIEAERRRKGKNLLWYNLRIEGVL